MKTIISPIREKVQMASLNPEIRYIDSCGGTRSGKTFSILETLIWLSSKVDKTATTTSIVSESVPHLKRGAIKDFKVIMRGYGIWIEDAWNKTDKIYTFPNGSMIEFFSADTPGKVHGASRDRLFINEAQNIPHEIARQLFVRTKGKIFLDYNPTHEFWVHKSIQGSGKEVTIHSTYKDNPFLTPEQIAEIESNINDSEWWNVYGLGKIGRRQGVIFQNWEQIAQVPVGAKPIGRGLDFGFTADPTAIIDVYMQDGAIILDERLYLQRLTNDIIATKLKAMEPMPQVIADSAEMKSIEEIKRLGIRNISPAKKGAGSINLGIDAMRRYPMKVTKRSQNLIHELRNYMWKVDKLSGEITNTPIDRYNHAIDAIRYVVSDLLTAPKRPSRGVRFNTLAID